MRIRPTQLSVLTIVMAFTLVLTVLVGLTAVSLATDDRELHLVHVISRHGERTPADTYPNDPYINSSFAPVGWGLLTNNGKKMMYETGKLIRERFDKFLGDLYNPDICYVQSTDSDRTKMTAELVHAGVFPPNSAQKWGPLDWQPVPVNYQPLSQDSLLLVRRPCAAYSLELEKIQREDPIKTMLQESQPLFNNLTRLTGMDIKSFEDVQSLYSTLKAEEMFGLKLPAWTDEFYPDKLLPDTIMDFVLNAYNTKLRRLKGGVFLKKILSDFYNAIKRSHRLGHITGQQMDKALAAFSALKDWPKQAAAYGKFPDARKLYLYCGHDSTISNLLSAMNAWDPQVPGYGITIFLEFSRDKTADEFGLEVYLRNSTAVPPFKLTLPGCESFCPISKLVKLAEPVIPYNWDEECKTDDPNYVPPPPGGP